MAKRGQAPGNIHSRVFVEVADAEEDFAFGREYSASGKLGLGKGDAEALADAHHLTRAPDLRAEHNIDAREFTEREDAFLDADVSWNRFLCQAELGHLA